VCQYRSANDEEPRFAIVTNLEEMAQWFNAAKLGAADIDSWHIAELGDTAN
jgi:hypothetical protein